MYQIRGAALGASFLGADVLPNNALLTDAEPHPIKWTSEPNAHGSSRRWLERSVALSGVAGRIGDLSLCKAALSMTANLMLTGFAEGLPNALLARAKVSTKADEDHAYAAALRASFSASQRGR